MVRLTRANSDKSDKTAMSDDKSSVMKTGSRLTLLVAPDAFHDGATFVQLPHPRTKAAALFCLRPEVAGAGACAELLKADILGSAFVGEEVISDGAPRLLSPLHPLFLVLPFLEANAKGLFVPLDQALEDPEFRGLDELRSLPRLLESLDLVADVKEIDESLRVCRWSEAKALGWLSGRVEKLVAFYGEEGSEHLHAAIHKDPTCLRRYCWGMVSDYLEPGLSGRLKTHMGIQEPILPQNAPPPKRTKSDPSPVKTKPVVAAVEKPKEKTPAQKRLAKASSGTKSLASFFKAK